jgi:hypothetical protein
MLYNLRMKVRTGYMLSQEAKDTLETLSDDIGISQTAVLELAIRTFKRIWESPIESLVQVQNLPKQETE